MGQSGAKIAFLFGEVDEYVPPHVEREALIARWEKHIRDGGSAVDETSSGILTQGSHTLKEGGLAVEELIAKVNGFVSRIDT